MTDVDDLNDLYLISDLMITDYSSTMFDYSVLKRPMVFHMYDLERYEREIRGFYFDLDELPGPITKTEEELAEAIRDGITNFDYDNNIRHFTINLTRGKTDMLPDVSWSSASRSHRIKKDFGKNWY